MVIYLCTNREQDLDHKSFMAINWDILIETSVIIAIVLFIWAKMSGQTIKEMIESVKDLFTDTKEEVVERGSDFVYYEWRSFWKRSTRTYKAI